MIAFAAAAAIAVVVLHFGQTMATLYLPTLNAEAAYSECIELGVPGLSFFGQVGYGGGAACATVQHAAMAVATGAASVVVCYRALNERSGRRFGQVSRAALQATSAGSTAASSGRSPRSPTTRSTCSRRSHSLSRRCRSSRRRRD